MISRARQQLPPGYEWNHVSDRYEHSNGSYIIIHADGAMLHYDAKPTDPKADANVPKAEPVFAIVGNRVSADDVSSAVKSEEYVVRGVLTICILTLYNGFTVTGESACAAPENFNAEIGKQLARKKAEDKIWTVLGFALRDRLHAAGAVV